MVGGGVAGGGTLASASTWRQGLQRVGRPALPPGWWAESPQLPPEGRPWLWRPPGEAQDRSPLEGLTPDGWKLPAPRRREACSSWAGARQGSAGEGGRAAGRFTPRPADWLRVAMSGGVCSILSACAAGVTSGRRRSVCGCRLPGRPRLLAPYISFTAPGSAAGQRRP